MSDKIDVLIQRVERLDGPSDLIDAEIYATIGGAPHTTTAGNRVIPLIKKGDPDVWPPVTASIDAAVALVERVLQGWEWAVGSDVELGIYGAVYQSTSIGGAGYSEEDMMAGANPAVALCLALLHALQDEKEGE